MIAAPVRPLGRRHPGSRGGHGRRLRVHSCAALLALSCAAAAAHAVPSFDEVRAAHRPSDIALLDRHGAVIQWQRTDTTVRRGPWLALADISPALREAIVLSEDRRFWAHGGVDWRALAAGAWANAWNSRTRGASTVTMQLAGLLDDDLARPAGGRTVAAKLGQLVRAHELEARWAKVQILEAYLNTVPLRGELVGIGAASQQLFGKHASGLDALEAAILAALVRGPNANAAAVTRRACEVLRLHQQLEPTQPSLPQQARAADAARADPCAGVATAAAQALARRPGAMLGEALAPHLARLMWRESRAAMHSASATAAAPPASAAVAAQPAGAAVAARALPSTLDATMQRIAGQALRRQLAELRGRNVEDGAALVLDNASGEVLAWVGSAGAGSGSAAAEVDAVLARRQPGSTIKPFVYALALERRLVTAASRIDDSPLQLAAGAAGLYTPRNYDHSYRGGVSVREALAGSLNVPAVRVAAMLGPEALFERLNAAGLRLAHNAGYHGHALALGSADVTLLDLANAYRMLARGGSLTPVRWWRSGGPAGAARPRASRVFGEPAAWLVSHILADPAARAATFGLDSPLLTRGFAAVKTGTSKDMRDNWCIGSTPRHTVAVWVGNASGQPMHGVSGISGAAPVWREIMLALAAAHGPAAAPPPPPGLVASNGEWYLAGTEPPPVPPGAAADTLARAAAAQPFGIESPRAGTVIALDPDIPPSAQRLVLRGAPGQWRLDGRLLGHGTRLEWLPRPGRHVLEWRDGLASERIEFDVRAAQPAAAPAKRAGPATPARRG